MIQLKQFALCVDTRTMMEQETAESYRKTVTGQITCATDKQ